MTNMELFTVPFDIDLNCAFLSGIRQMNHRRLIVVFTFFEEMSTVAIKFPLNESADDSSQTY